MSLPLEHFKPMETSKFVRFRAGTLINPSTFEGRVQGRKFEITGVSDNRGDTSSTAFCSNTYTIKCYLNVIFRALREKGTTFSWTMACEPKEKADKIYFTIITVDGNRYTLRARASSALSDA
jgi:hypothetical protein